VRWLDGDPDARCIICGRPAMAHLPDGKLYTNGAIAPTEV